MAVLLLFTPEYGKAQGITNISAGTALLYFYVANCISDLLCPVISQLFRSRKIALYLFLTVTVLAIVIFTSIPSYTNYDFYIKCSILGIGIGYNLIIKTKKDKPFKLIEKIEPLSQTDTLEIYTKHRGTTLTAQFFPDTTKTLLQPESIIANDVVPSVTPKEKADRNKLKKKYCEFKDDKWIVKTPIEFSSPSGAIKFGVGSNINGWKYWLINETGKFLETIRKS